MNRCSFCGSEKDVSAQGARLICGDCYENQTFAPGSGVKILKKEFCQSWLNGTGALTLVRSITGEALLKAVFTPGGVGGSPVSCVETVQKIRRRIEDRLRKDDQAVLDTAAALGILPQNQVD